jgi:hypothetical protein
MYCIVGAGLWQVCNCLVLASNPEIIFFAQNSFLSLRTGPESGTFRMTVAMISIPSALFIAFPYVVSLIPHLNQASEVSWKSQTLSM